MVQLRLLSGKQAGTDWVARRFPVHIGRSPAADLQVEEDGLWDQHAVVLLDPQEGFLLRAQSQALASVNDQPVQQAVLRNGDIIDLGSLKLQFWLTETSQAGLTLRELAVWAGIGMAVLCEVGLMYWLLVGNPG